MDPSVLVDPREPGLEQAESRPPEHPERLQEIAASLAPLRSSSRVLNAQLGSVVEHTDAAAHELVTRLSTISKELHAVVETVTRAWHEDSSRFVAEIERATREREAAIRALRELQQRREQTLKTDGERWGALLTDAGEMQSNVEGIRQLAQTARILTINARIEAAHAGENGRAFDIIASEMRKLTEGVDRIAGEVGGRVESMGAMIRADHVADTEQVIAAERATVEELEQRLDQLGAFEALQRSTAGLLERLAASTESIELQVREALASVQFQDISRQKIEQVTKALATIDEHIGRVVDYAGSERGELDASAVGAAAMLSQYVMQSQREIHAQATGEICAEVIADDAPAIELF